MVFRCQPYFNTHTALEAFCWQAVMTRGTLHLFVCTQAINTAVPSIVNQLQRRVCFYTGPDPPPFRDEDVLYVPLTEHNYYQVAAPFAALYQAQYSS